MRTIKEVAPARERGLKCIMPETNFSPAIVAPARERGLKWPYSACICYTKRRSRKGAWIEMRVIAKLSADTRVAPARERGLKSVPLMVIGLTT